MQVQCPQCQSYVELDASDSLSDLSCLSCGSQLDLLGDETLELDGSTAGATEKQATAKSVGHFELIERLGSGGFGTVWKARDKTLDRVVAVKIPRKDQLTPTEREVFFREARAAAQLQHPHIVSVHEVGRDHDQVYIVSDLIEGLPLSKWSKKHRISINASVEMCRKVAQALHHAHQCGVIHRDVKPSNIMVDKSGEPHIMDFGLAKRESSEITMAVDGHAFGTPAYMSPEQARGDAHNADCRSDVYSLGVILFQLLTGEVPFRGSSAVLVQQVLNDEPPHVRSLNRSVPEDLDTICWKSMEKLPQRRYPTAEALSDELQRFLRGEPIEARPISRLARSWRWCRRNPAVAALSFCVALVLSVGMIGVTTQWRRAEANADQARQAAIAATIAAEGEKQSRAEAEHFLYIARMNTVQQAYELGDLVRVRSILDTYAGPFTAGNDPRGFEWNYWSRQSHRWLDRYQGHQRPVFAVDISVDGRWIASGSASGTLRIWDSSEETEVKVIQAHDETVYALDISPDGKRVATGSRDKKIRIWDLETGRQLQELPGHNGTVFALSYSGDGSTIASAGSDTLVKTWNVNDGTLRQSFKGHFDFVYGVDISADAKKVASCGLDRTVMIWDAMTGEPIHTLEGHAIEVWDVAFSPDGSTLASASADKTIRLWDVESGDLKEILHGHADRVRSVAFTPDAKTLISVGNDRTIRTWDLLREDQPLSVPVRNLRRRPDHFFERMSLPKGKQRSLHVGHEAPVTSVAISADGNQMVTGSEDSMVVVWELRGFNDRSVIQEHNASINTVTFSSDGAMLASASNDKTVRLWDPRSGEAQAEPMPHKARVLSVAFSPDNQTLATGSYDGSVMLWDVQSGESVLLEGHRGGVSKVVFSPNGRLLASTGHDKTIRIWNVADRHEQTVLLGHEGRIYNAVFLDEQRLASTGSDRSVRIWDIPSATQINVLSGHEDRVWALAKSCDGLLASGGEDRSIRIWDPTNGHLIRTLIGHADLVQSLAFAPDGKTLASGSGDKTIKLWDVATGESKATLKGHGHRVWSLEFDPKGTTLASSSYSIKLWRGTPINQ